MTLGLYSNYHPGPNSFISYDTLTYGSYNKAISKWRIKGLYSAQVGYMCVLANRCTESQNTYKQSTVALSHDSVNNED
jgi:hypothetical protein